MSNNIIELKKISDYIWEIPKKETMLVPGIIYGDEEIIKELQKDVNKESQWNSLQQIQNVATLPGIVKASLAMADVHPGYGFCIGGVGAFDFKEGIICVAGVGFDINCGVRLLSTPLSRGDLKDREETLSDLLFGGIPAGVGVKGELRLNKKEITGVLLKGARFATERGYGIHSDLEYIEENGCLSGGDPDNVSDMAIERQLGQVGTLGSGNHYLEIQEVKEIFDEKAAEEFGIFKGQLLVAIHSGSRALGHQIGTDYLKTLHEASIKYKIPILERELVCAPIESPEGQKYYSALVCGINCAFANRQVLAHIARRIISKFFKVSPDKIETIYDIAHNNAKIEYHNINGKKKKLLIHRKGATRAFGPGSNEIPERYREIGQPVIVGGTMGTYSYILHGTEKGMEETFGSAIHGAGRLMSRHQAIKNWKGRDIVSELNSQGIIIKGATLKGLAEEAPGAYKSINQVVDVMHNSGIAKKVAKTRPIICIKG